MKPLTLRATLRGLGIGALVYVVVIAAIIAIRITPTARALSAHSERVRAEYQSIDARAALLRSTIDEIQLWLYTVDRPGAMRPALASLRERIDSLNTSAPSASGLSGIPAAMRVQFSQANVEQSRAVVALLEALTNLEQGRRREAERQLARADSMANLHDRHQAAAQRLGLEDLIVREQSLAGAASASIRAVGWWLLLGALVTPFVAILLRRRLYDPLADLEEGITQVAEGDLGWTIPVRRADELGRLSEHFNEATAILCQRAEETRQRATTALRESEERYTAMFGAAPIGIAIVDSAGRYAHTNPALQRFLGYSESELRGKSYRDVTLPDDVGESDRRFAALIAGGYDRYSVEKRYVRKDGALVWGRVSVAGVRDAAGTLTHTVSMIEDVTDEKRLQEAQRRAEEARHKSEEKFSTAFRMNPNPSVIARLDDGLLVEVNDAYCAVSGYTRDEVIGKSAREMLWAEPERRDDFVRRLQDQGRIRELEQKMKSKFGPQLDVLLSVEIIDLDGVAHVLASAVDITNRKRAAEALRKSEEKFAKAFQASPNPIIITEHESGILVDANDAFFTTFGYAREEAIGRPTHELVWEQQGLRDQYLAQLEAEGRLRGVELALHTKSGDPVQILMSVEMIELAGSRYLLIEGLDITLRKQATEALRESEQRFRRLVQDMSIGVALLDSEGRVLHANPAAREILAVTEEELRDPSFWNREMIGLREDGSPYAADDRPVWNAVRRGTRLHNVLVGVPARGRPANRWVLANVDPQRDADGSVRNVIVWFSDITDQRKAEHQLRLLAQAVKSTTESISITDVAGYLTFVNRGFAEACGYTEAELIGKHVSLIDSPRNPHALQDEVRTVTMARGTWTGEMYNRRKNGTDFLITLTTAQVKDEQGHVIALMGVSSDITERKQLQESLRRSETMSALGSVVAGVAHEVRNPLFGISATVDAFHARFGEQPGYERYAKTLRQEVGRLTKLMQDLLEYGKPQRLDVSRGPVAPVVQRAVAACTALAETSGVSIREALADDLPSIPMDQSRIQQVFQNLIDNAIQHSPPGKSVVITANRAGHGADAMVEITITDEGIGFRAEDLPHLFEPFFTRRRGGTGLGLSIVQRILEQHEGEIVAGTGASGGAVMTVRLPLARDTASEPARV
jgi:PAS domain S-box-containing protein